MAAVCESLTPPAKKLKTDENNGVSTDPLPCSSKTTNGVTPKKAVQYDEKVVDHEYFE